MKQISNKEYEKYQQYQTDKLHGRVLTPDGLRIVCAGLDNDPEKIGIHMLEMLAKFTLIANSIGVYFTMNAGIEKHITHTYLLLGEKPKKERMAIRTEMEEVPEDESMILVATGG